MFKVTSRFDSADVYIEGPDGKIFADAGVTGLYPTQEEADAATRACVANARRIAACLNACAGLDTKIVSTIAAFGGMCQDNAVAAVIKQRDELRDALIGLMNDIGGGKKACGHDFTCICAMDKARAVLKGA